MTLPAEHIERLKCMVEDDGQTWDLSPNDKAAIEFALRVINDYRKPVADLGKDKS